MKKFLAIGSALAFVLVGIGIVFGIESLKESVNSTEVLVVDETIPFKEQITEEHLKVVSVPTEQVIEGALKPQDSDYVVGAYTSIAIPKETQIHDSFLDRYDLIPNEKEGEFIAPIPTDWLYAVPQSLRQSYIADFYAISKDDEELLESYFENKEEANKNNDEELINDELEEETKEVITKREPFLTNVRIASVKDRTNREVVTETEEGTATGVISTIEIIANDEILNTLRDYVDQGNKIYVVYRYNPATQQENVDESEESNDES